MTFTVRSNSFKDGDFYPTPTSFGRIWLRLPGQQPIAASGLVGGARWHEELCRHLFRSRRSHRQRLLALAGGEHPCQRDGVFADAGNPKAAKLPQGALQTRTDFGTPGYGGPCPPAGDHPHRYLFTVFAVGIDHLSVTADTSAAIIGFQLHFNTLARTAIMGLYKR